MGEIASIVYKPADLAPEDRYARVPLTTATLVVGHGIEGDRKGGHPKRQLNLMSFEVLQALAAEGFRTQPGQMGEQIVIRGLDVDRLVEGSRLQLGAQAWVEVLSHRTGCDRFARLQGKAPEMAAGRMGVMARVLVGGTIHVGDRVDVLRVEASPAG